MNDRAVAFVTDSTAEIHALEPEAEWFVVPLELEIDGRRFREGPELSSTEFQHLLQEVNTVPATLPPSADIFAAVYEPLLAVHERLLSVHLSGALSETVANAQAAARALDAEDRIAVIDSRVAGLALGLLCLEAEARIGAGANVDATRDGLERIIAATRIYFSVFTLDFLYLSGRLERPSRLGSASTSGAYPPDDRPILTMQEGRLALIERVIGERTRVQRIAELLAGEYGLDEPLVAACVYAGRRGEEAAARLERVLTVSRSPATAWYRAPLGPVLCAHTGFDVCGIAVYPQRLSSLRNPVPSGRPT